MKVLSVPWRLRLATLVLFLGVPLAGIEVMLVTRAPWWELPLRTLQIWMGAFFLITLPVSIWIAQGKRWAFYFYKIFSVLWLIATVVLALKHESLVLAVFFLVLALSLYTIQSWIKVELLRSCLNPRMEWYQGRPKILPGVYCQAQWKGGKKLDGSVSRMDEGGTFLYFREKLTGKKAKNIREVHLSFVFGEHAVSCNGRVVRVLDSEQGIGVQFFGLTHDQKKSVGDFCETLRGMGYVS